jgi:hypothetical protein
MRLLRGPRRAIARRATAQDQILRISDNRSKRVVSASTHGSVIRRTTATLVVVAAAMFMASCATVEPHMMPAPAVFKDERLDFMSRLPQELRATRVPVFYAAINAPPDDSSVHAEENPREALSFGVAQVRLGKAQWDWSNLLASDRASDVSDPRPAAVERTEEIGRADAGGDIPPQIAQQFIARVDRHLERTVNQDVVLYVHGYRVTFAEVAATMGSFGHYLGHGTMVFFRWPTGLHFWNYSDCDRAERYISDIERVVALLARTRARYINVLAYSCGSPLLARALVQLRARHPSEDRAALARRYRLGNVIFAASDIDLKTFAREYVPPIMDLAEQTIVYLSRNDRALWFANFVGGASRLGRPNAGELAQEDIERLAADPRLQGIDVSDVRGAHEMGGMRGHGYWYANEWVSTDMAISLRYPIPPRERCLVNDGGGNIWRFPKDYVQCLADRLLRVAPELRGQALPDTSASPGESRETAVSR